MDPYTSPNPRAELDAILSSIQTIAERYTNMMLNMDTEALVKVTQPADIPSLSALAIPFSAPQDIDQVLREAFEIFDHRLRTNHPRFFSFIPSPASPLSFLGDSLTSSFNTFAGCKLEGAGPSAIEKSLIEWLAERVGLPDTAGGVFVSGGSMANLTAIAVARDQIVPCGKEALGVAYVTDQTHSSVAKALRILGFRGHQIWRLPADEKFRMDPQTLQRAIHEDREAGRVPFVVIATCGTTNTGSVDPLSDISSICRKERLWMHVDGAYGASASLSASHRHMVSGLELADSISWDAHKWLFQTYGCGLILVRDKKHLLDSFATDAEYMRDITEEQDVPNFWNYGIELTKPARAMKLWFTMRVLGVDTLGRMIDQGFHLAERAEQELRKRRDWEITSPACMAILTFRFAPSGKSERGMDALNVALSKRLLEENVAGILTTELRGRVVLRICPINPRLSGEEMADTIERLDLIAHEL
ncbi:PLP-dependent transferase [Trematosphaeria pertusa]|uniref:PLP-dependent transferase n=1 Tax=Trematosphaeria pertusa TaxID=390896 RepID=A0A6A6HW51_9PLEO|nr:PLP-dependent transferase [Trematosphaeria pertusa]KAF2242257.1 PLP-dependent transferase [Trematosphaeria pertusa]